MEFKVKFNSIEELNEWLNWCCTRCAMRNRDCGRSDPCSVCRANKIYETRKKDLKGGNK